MRNNSKEHLILFGFIYFSTHVRLGSFDLNHCFSQQVLFVNKMLCCFTEHLCGNLSNCKTPQHNVGVFVYLTVQYAVKDSPVPLVSIQQMPLFPNTVSEAIGMLIIALMNSKTRRQEWRQRLTKVLSYYFPGGCTQLVSCRNPCMVKPYPQG